MFRVLASDLRRAILSPLFLLSCIAISVSLSIGGFGDFVDTVRNLKGGVFPDGYHVTFFLDCLSSDAFFLFLPVLCALPYTSSCLSDFQSGFIKTFLPRAGKKNYIIGKLTVCGISGGLVPVLGILLFWLSETLLIKPKEISGGILPEHFFDRLFLLFLFGAFCSLLGMSVSFATGCFCLAPLSPFMVIYLLLILKQRYLRSAFFLDMKNWIAPDPAQWFLGGFTPGLLLLLLSCLCCLWFFFHVQRRISQL